MREKVRIVWLCTRQGGSDGPFSTLEPRQAGFLPRQAGSLVFWYKLFNFGATTLVINATLPTVAPVDYPLPGYSMNHFVVPSVVGHEIKPMTIIAQKNT